MDTTFTITALIGGTVLVFQFVMLMIGLGDDGGGDAVGGHDVGGMEGHDFSGGAHGDFSGGVDGDVTGGMDADALGQQHASWSETADADMGHPEANWFYEVLSIRTLSAALTFFGITGKTALANGYTNTHAFLAASVVGIAAMYAVYWLFKQVYKLQHAGNENIRNAIGLPATVYVPIPGKRAGTGKVTFKLQNRLVEYQAVTEDDQRLATGEKVVVVAIVSSDTVRVSRATAPVEI